MATITTDGYTFDFPKALDVFEFDSEDPNDLHYHGFPEMKAVDILVEFTDICLFIEVKDFFNPKLKKAETPKESLFKDLKYKYRDSYLYQLAHGKISKPIIYICLLDHLEAPMMMQLSKNLGKAIPDENHLPNGWSKSFLKTTIVVDKTKWNSNLTKWGIVK